MEMPISVIITLFVVLIVGITVLNFAIVNIRDAEDNINNFDPDLPEQNERIFEVDTVSSEQLAFSVKECLKEFFRKSFNNEFCTIFRANSAYSLGATQQTEIYTELKKYPDLYESDGTAGVTDAEVDAYTVVTQGNSSVWFVKWNGEITKVA